MSENHGVLTVEVWQHEREGRKYQGASLDRYKRRHKLHRRKGVPCAEICREQTDAPKGETSKFTCQHNYRWRRPN